MPASLGAAVLNGAAGLDAAAEASGANDLGRGIADRSVVGTAVALAGMLPVGRVAKAGKIVDGMHLPVNDALDAAVDFLGKGYKEVELGRFVSEDGLRQVRMMIDDITGVHGKGPHMNFETKTPKQGRAGKFEHENAHVYLDGQ